jgi:ATP-dependent DNA ligase
LQAEAETHATCKFVVTGAASPYLLRAMKIKPLPAGFVIPAQPVLASKPPSGADWVYEIKHDGYRMIVRRDGPTVRLYSRVEAFAERFGVACPALTCFSVPMH